MSTILRTLARRAWLAAASAGERGGPHPALTACVVAACLGCASPPDRPFAWSVSEWAEASPGTEWDLGSGLPVAVKDRATGIELRLVPPGRARLLSPSGKKVTLRVRKPVYFGRFEVSVKQWRQLSGLPLDGKSEVAPVRWADPERADRILRRWGFRLPTVEEWFYAASGAGRAAPHWLGQEPGEDWHAQHGPWTRSPPGERVPNEFGLHDINGNVLEWAVGDGDYFPCDCAFRCYNESGSDRSTPFGLRVARDP